MLWQLVTIVGLVVASPQFSILPPKQADPANVSEERAAVCPPGATCDENGCVLPPATQQVGSTDETPPQAEESRRQAVVPPTPEEAVTQDREWGESPWDELVEDTPPPPPAPPAPKPLYRFNTNERAMYKTVAIVSFVREGEVGTHLEDKLRELRELPGVSCALADVVVGDDGVPYSALLSYFDIPHFPCFTVFFDQKLVAVVETSKVDSWTLLELLAQGKAAEEKNKLAFPTLPDEPEVPAGPQEGDLQLWYFTASWCGPCQTQKPIMLQMQRDGFPVVIIDVDANKATSASLSIRTIPAICVMQYRGGRWVKVSQVTGQTSRASLEGMYRRAEKATPQRPNHTT